MKQRNNNDCLFPVRLCVWWGGLARDSQAVLLRDLESKPMFPRQGLVEDSRAGFG